MKISFMQVVRLVGMVLAIGGIIYALEFMERGIAVWLGIGFVGLLWTFRLTQRRMAREERARQRSEKKKRGRRTRK